MDIVLRWLQGLLGLVAFLYLAWALSEDRSRVPWRVVAWGLVLQVLTAAALLYVPACRAVFMWFNALIVALQEATCEGTSLVFGYLGGAELPFEPSGPGSTFVLAFRSLPLVLLVSALSAVLFHWGVLQRVVEGFSWVLQRTMGVGGVEGVGVAANVFAGMVEAPLLIRPYVARMTRSELFTVMTAGMATIAGTVMALYAGFLSQRFPDIAGHILTASVISAPASVVVAKLMVPESGAPSHGGPISHGEYTSAMDAVTQGAMDGVKLLISIVAMLIVLVGLVHLVNMGLGVLPQTGGAPLTLQRIFGWLFAPVAWLVGVPPGECLVAGRLLGTKTVLNELLAYLDMSQLPPAALSPRSVRIMTYALCGFANPGSLGIMLGGLGAMAPERRHEIVDLGWRSLIAGTLAACMTGTVAGLLLS